MFENVKFCGAFRSYQQKILDNADDYLDDGKINIVAAPGSGKTILGLELIRRLGKPCIILSPTTTIRDQWGQRFSESFLPQGMEPSDFVSFDLRNCSAITSITYQALYSAVEKVKCDDGEDVDYSDIDLFKTVGTAGVETICLDEAHHLQNEWQRALEKFLKKLDGKVKIISLTATPPYDANAGEWKRYTDVCGDIDEEIFVPELVRQGTLCPHQDYIYFNYPSESEAAEFKDYKKRVCIALEELFQSRILEPFARRLFESFGDEAFIYTNVKQIKQVLSLFEASSIELDKRALRGFPYDGAKRKKNNGQKEAEDALNFLLEAEIFGADIKDELKKHFAKHKLLPRGKVCFEMSDKLKRALVSSSGKLESIEKIAQCESVSLGKDLRLLALCDYIKKEDMRLIRSGARFDTVSVISVFETLRKSCALPAGALSGGLVILPLSCGETLKKRGARFTVKPLKDTDYAEYVFSGGNKEKVEHVGALFESGEINVLVGTKSLLGEGWDSPCINSLILASFVGSFMLSNQMRGRAIRVDKNNPEKTSNIWHLVTVEPEYIFEESLLERKFLKLTESRGEIISNDFETLTRRFNCFVAPAYDTGIIESGIERISNVRPPFSEENFQKINADMCERARKRDELKKAWETALEGSAQLCNVTNVPNTKKFPVFNFMNFGLWAIVMSLAAVISGFTAVACVYPYGGEYNVFLIVAGIFASVFLYGVTLRLGYKILAHKSPKRSIKNLADAVLKTLKELYLVDGSCRLSVKADGICAEVSAGLNHASERDAKLFQTAIAELFSAIDNQRYVLIPTNFLGKYNYLCALACPSVFGAKKEYAGQFVRNLKKTLGRLELVYTRGEGGGRVLARCRKFSYINFNEDVIRKMQRL
ncbi:MAG: DEAD/DEAH box helicase family protein [Clostridia bacterium]|nr:DEAD/DEAH box helicase family protein [Clostridia bacterium]